jgi:DNA-binding transcriptional LysR family regulator
MLNLNLRHLEALSAVSAAGNFTRAAQSLHVSQPALTVQIRQLEEALGVKLLDRNTRSVRLTRIGEQLTPVIQRLLREIEAVVTNAHELASGDRGVVSVSALPSVCSTVLPRIISDFRKQYPGISVLLRDGVAQRVLEKVKNGEVDLAVGSFPDADLSMEVIPLFTDNLRVVFPPHSPLERKRSVRLKDLIDYPLIVMDPQSSLRAQVNRAFESIGHFLTPAYEVTYMSTAVGLAKAGLGVAILPSSTLEMSELSGLRSRSLSSPRVGRTIAAAHLSGRSLSPAAASFLKCLIAACRSASIVESNR